MADDLAGLPDDELFAELYACEDPDEATQLRALLAQRGLHNAGLRIPEGERRRIAQEQGGGAP